MDKTISTALFGFGRAGKIHYNNLKKNDKFILKYIYDKNTEKVIKEVEDCIVTFDLNRILVDKEVKLVIISTPTNLHYDLVVQSLNNNKNVLCEKPLSNKESEVVECYDLAKKNKLVLLCAFNRRFDPQIIKLKNDVESNKVGKIHQITTISRDYPYPNINYLKISSGIFHDCVVHDIDFINWIVSDIPINVYVTGNIVKSKELNDGNLDNAIIILEYKDNLLVTINASRISTNYDQRIEIYGENGVLISKNPYGDIDCFSGDPISFPERYDLSYKNELNYIYELILTKKENMITKKDCINCLRIVEACEESFKNKKKIIINYKNSYRDYTNVQESIKLNYKLSRQNQTLEFVNNMHKKYLKFDKKMKLSDVFKNLESFVDVSDPDLDLPNFYHGLQTAEKIREDNHPEWLQLLGLIHDIGKIIYLWGCDNDGTSLKKQWGIVGDTFIVGCKLSDKLVFPEFNSENPDMLNVKYNTKLGIYKEGCGLENVKCSWGHDEYLYQVLKYNKCNIPEEGMYIIRYHSLYAYHTHNEYQYFMNEKDNKMIEWLKLFNKYDLYTKNENINFSEETKLYYNKLVNKYLNNGELYF